MSDAADTGDFTHRSEIWKRLKRLTPARIGLGRAGSALPTAEVLRFGVAHAEARDAVQARLDVETLQANLVGLGLTSIIVESQATDRATYLQRPDLGRRLSARSAAALVALPKEPLVDLAIVIADGLSARAIEAHAVKFVAALKPWIAAARWSLGPLVLATQARVALGDEAGALLAARAVMILIGERPGLSSPDSLGAYLTLSPKTARTDAERNCISNIRSAGLGYDHAAFKAAWIATASSVVPSPTAP